MGRYHDPKGRIKSRMVIQFILPKQVFHLHRAETKEYFIKNFNNSRIISLIKRNFVKTKLNFFFFFIFYSSNICISIRPVLAFESHLLNKLFESAGPEFYIHKKCRNELSLTLIRIYEQTIVLQSASGKVYELTHLRTLKLL